MVKDRRTIINEIQSLRGSKVICFVLGDRPSLDTRIHPEVLPIFYKLLRKPSKKYDKIDLFLYGEGGVTIAAWGLANLLNEFADHYNVLIPFKALSALTLISLGAKQIIMTELGQLSPIDPSVNSPYNPEAPDQKQGTPRMLLPVPVEDCIAFLDLARTEAKIKTDAEIVHVFSMLAEKVHPLALGNVYRSREQIKMLSEKLLARNMKDQSKRDKIISMLTKQLYSHDYIMSRSEANDLIQLPIHRDEKTESLISDLYSVYEADGNLGQPYSPELEYQKSLTNNGEMIYSRAFVESDDQCYSFISQRKFSEISIQRPGVPFKENVIKQQEIFQGWRLINE